VEIIGIASCLLLLLRALVVSASEFDDDDDDFDGNRDDDSDDDGRVFVAAIERVKRRRRKLEKEERGKFVHVLLLLFVVSKNPRGDVLGNFRELPERFSAVESESDERRAKTPRRNTFTRKRKGRRRKPPSGRKCRRRLRRASFAVRTRWVRLEDASGRSS
jgi:hypothetical protein